VALHPERATKDSRGNPIKPAERSWYAAFVKGKAGYRPGKGNDDGWEAHRKKRREDHNKSVKAAEKLKIKNYDTVVREKGAALVARDEAKQKAAEHQQAAQKAKRELTAEQKKTEKLQTGLVRISMWVKKTFALEEDGGQAAMLKDMMRKAAPHLG